MHACMVFAKCQAVGSTGCYRVGSGFTASRVCSHVCQCPVTLSSTKQTVTLERKASKNLNRIPGLRALFGDHQREVRDRRTSTGDFFLFPKEGL